MSQEMDAGHLDRKPPAGDGVDAEGGAQQSLSDPAPEQMDLSPDSHEGPARGGADGEGAEGESIVAELLPYLVPTMEICGNPDGDGINSEGGENESRADPSLEKTNPTQDNSGNRAGDGTDSQTAAHQSVVDPSLEFTDPNPDIHRLFKQYNERFFEGCLVGVEVKWSYKMTSAAGACEFGRQYGSVTIVLSEPLLKLRPRKDLVETLLHEMIHAYLMVKQRERSRHHHGPEFRAVMERVNREAGTAITVCHDFDAEVLFHCQHWFRCDGPCGRWLPCFGRKRHKRCPPWPRLLFYRGHRASCGGTYRKVHRPERHATSLNKALLWPSMEDLDNLDLSIQARRALSLAADRATRTLPVVPDQSTQTLPVVPDQSTQTLPVEHDESTQTLPVGFDQATQTLPVEHDESTQALPVGPDQSTQTLAVVHDQETQTPATRDQATQTPANRNRSTQTPPVVPPGVGTDGA